MKTIFILSIFSLLLATACNKEENNATSGFPMIYNMYFDLQRPDGSSFNEGEVEAKGAYLNEAGELIFQEEWFELPVNSDFSDVLEKRVFGPFELGMGWESGQEPEEGTEWVANHFLLLRYQGISEIDTLRSKTSARYPDYYYFDIFKNDELIVRLNDPDNYTERPWYITIQK
jgi:hypothetical protein